MKCAATKITTIALLSFPGLVLFFAVVCAVDVAMNIVDIKEDIMNIMEDIIDIMETIMDITENDKLS